MFPFPTHNRPHTSREQTLNAVSSNVHRTVTPVQFHEPWICDASVRHRTREKRLLDKGAGAGNEMPVLEKITIAGSDSTRCWQVILFVSRAFHRFLPSFLSFLPYADDSGDDNNSSQELMCVYRGRGHTLWVVLHQQKELNCCAVEQGTTGRGMYDIVTGLPAEQKTEQKEIKSYGSNGRIRQGWILGSRRSIAERDPRFLFRINNLASRRR